MNHWLRWVLLSFMFLPIKMIRIELFAGEYGSDGSRIRSDSFACLIRDNESGRRTGPVRLGHWAQSKLLGRARQSLWYQRLTDCAVKLTVLGKENGCSLKNQNLTADKASSKTAGLPLASLAGSDSICRKRRAPGKPVMNPSMWRVMPCIFRPLPPYSDNCFSM